MINRMSQPLSIVLGANGRIGSATVNSLLDKGNIVIGIDIQEKSIYKSIASTYIYLSGDYSSLDLQTKLKARLDELQENYSFIESIVNLTRIPLQKSELMSSSQAEVSGAIASVYGITYLIDYLLSISLISNTSIIHVSSLDAWYISRQPTLYHMVKGATLSISRSLAWKLGKWNIRSNVVMAGLVNDPEVSLDKKARKVQSYVIPLKSGPPSISDIIKAILFLSSTNACSITGTCIVVDAGMSLPSTYSIAQDTLEG